MLKTPLRPHDYYSLESREIHVQIPGHAAPIKIHYKTAGTGNPLLLIHGLMTDSYSFRYVISDLARNYRVIAPDMPGAGLSDAPTDLAMSPRNMAKFLSALISTLELDRPYVVGNSMGGYEALWLALLEPECIEKLMVMHSPGFPEFRVRALKWAAALPGSETLYRHLVQRAPEKFVAKNVHYNDPNVMSDEEATHYAKIFRNPARTRVFWRILRETLGADSMREFVGRLTEEGPQLSKRLPIRLLWAREDAMVPPSFGPRYKQLLPESDLVWLENTSHFMQVESPRQVVEEIRKFDQLSCQRTRR